MNPGAEARKLLRHCRTAGLATHSRRLQGFPYASVVPLMTDHDACPIMLISRLAEHTANIEADERASLVVYASNENVQAAPRLTLIGSCRRAADRQHLEQRYLRYFPEAARLLALDFDLYRISVTAARYIEGFGLTHWLSAEAMQPPAGTFELQARSLELANTVDQQALRDACHRVHAVDVQDVCMIAVDCDGFDIRADDRLLRFDFADTVHDAEAARSALAHLLREGRT